MDVSSPLLLPKAAAEYLGQSPASLQRGRMEGWGPPYVLLSRRKVAYRRQDLDAWIASRLVTSTANARERGLTAA